MNFNGKDIKVVYIAIGKSNEISTESHGRREEGQKRNGNICSRASAAKIFPSRSIHVSAVRGTGPAHIYYIIKNIDLPHLLDDPCNSSDA